MKLPAILFTALCLNSSLLTSSLLLNSAAQAQTPRSNTIRSTPQLISRNITFHPPNGGAPRETRGAASRGEDACFQAATVSSQPFMSLLPANLGIGLTLSEHPTFYAYVPPTSAKQAFFTLKDETGNVHYQTRFTLPETSGIVPVVLPETAPALEVGKNYEWGVALLCEGRLRPDSPFISSWVKRTEVTTELADKLNTAAALDQVAIYGENGFWYDTIESLAILRKQDPTNSELANTWTKLLDSVGLGAIATEPLTE